MTTVQEQPQKTSTKKQAGKVALVTGGSRGIGAGIALRLAEEGAHVAITYAKSADSAEQVVAQLKELGINAKAFKSDATKAAESKKLVDEVVKEFGRIDILVNNAGVFEMAPLEKIDLEHYERIYNVNVKGVIATTIAALPKIPNGGRIINISSVAATTAMPGASVYSSTKAALDSLTRIWAQELGARKITVNAVAPGTTASDMYDTVPEEMKQQFISKTALGRVGTPEDIAAVVAFLASKDGGWVTGQSIISSGGLLG